MNTNKYLSRILIASLLVTSMLSCEKELETFTPPSVSEFSTFTLNSSYYIRNLPNSQFKIPVGITTVSNQARIVELTITSPTGAVNGTHYTAPASITIPAGAADDSLVIAGIFDAYNGGRVDTLNIKITGGDVPPNAYGTSYRLILRQYCDVILSDLVGVYTNTRETNAAGGSAYGPYTSTISDPVQTSATTGTVVLGNFWDYGVDVLAKLDWTDPANFKITIDRQALGIDYAAGQPMDVRTAAGQPNSFSSCSQEFNLSVDFLVNNYPTAGQTAAYSLNYKIYIKR